MLPEGFWWSLVLKIVEPWFSVLWKWVSHRRDTSEYSGAVQKRATLCLAVLEAALPSQRVLGPEVLSTNLRDGPASLPFQMVYLPLVEQKDLCAVYVGKLGQHKLAASFPDTQEVICKFYRGQHFI